MKTITLLLLSVSFNCFAASDPIKECNTVVKMDNKTMEAQISFVEKDHKTTVIMKQKIDGHTIVIKDVAKISEHDIKKDLLNTKLEDASDEFLNSLNTGEKYILHAATLSDEESIKEFMGFLDEGKLKNECSAKEEIAGAGFDLRKVKHVKVYEIQGEPGDMSKLAVIEATDEKGKILGSFFGGFFVSPCK